MLIWFQFVDLVSVERHEFKEFADIGHLRTLFDTLALPTQARGSFQGSLHAADTAVSAVRRDVNYSENSKNSQTSIILVC